MFYCDDCAVKNKWPSEFWMPKSFGPCEVCGRRAACTDTPSRALPIPPRDQLRGTDATARDHVEGKDSE